jgi:hypothetical protein
MTLFTLGWFFKVAGGSIMGMGDTLIRGRLQHKYHLCDRCGVRYPLSQLAWQFGFLVCLSNCYDTQITSQRDGEIARKVAVAGQSRELEPDYKIVDAATVDTDDLEFVP